jgi:hypothetical protein
MGIAFEARQECRTSFAPPILHTGRLSNASAISDVFFAGEIVGGKRLRGTNIVLGQPWVVNQDRLGRHSGAEFAQNQCNRNTGAANDGSAIHDIRVYFDAFMDHGARQMLE